MTDSICENCTANIIFYDERWNISPLMLGRKQGCLLSSFIQQRTEGPSQCKYMRAKPNGKQNAKNIILYIKLYLKIR
jgi:hypothetical protein